MICHHCGLETAPLNWHEGPVACRDAMKAELEGARARVTYLEGCVQKLQSEHKSLMELYRQKSKEAEKLLDAVRRHHAARGHDRCWECDRELYEACGLIAGELELPPVEEHRLKCDEYRAGLYGTPVKDEPCHELGRLMERLEKLKKAAQGMLSHKPHYRDGSRYSLMQHPWPTAWMTEYQNLKEALCEPD